MNKRIKIERPEDLREGMRVEVNYEKGGKITGKLWKGKTYPESKILFVRDNFVRTKDGEFHNQVQSIHRLIDGIEDVVVGDLLKGGDGIWIRKVFDVRHNLVDVSSKDEFLDCEGWGSHYNTYTFNELDAEGWKIYIPTEEPQKTELTETEAKEIIAEVKGVEPEDIIITK